MTILGKLVFIFLVLFIYCIAFLVSRNNSIKAIEKIFVLFFGSALLLSIIFSETVWVILPRTLGVERGTDSVLYLFIIVSTSVNFILLRKILELEDKLLSFKKLRLILLKVKKQSEYDFIKKNIFR